MPRSRWAVRPLLMGFVIDALGVSGPPRNPDPPEGASLVVLPLVATGDDQDQAYLSVGLTEDLTTALAQSSRYVFVISSETAFTYQGQTPDPGEVGRELGVRYILEGSVGRDGDRVSVATELIEAASGRTLWEERYQRDLVDLPALKRDIVEAILVAVGFELEQAELTRLAEQPSASVGAVEALWQGYYHLRQLTRDDLMQARALFRKAAELEPGLASAHGMLAGTYTQEHSQGWSLDPTLLDTARQLATKGVELDETSGVCHAILGVVELVEGNWEAAVAHEDRAISLEPSVTWPHALRGMALTQGRKPLEASRSIKRALRLDPRPPHGLLMAVSYINYNAGRREEAVELLEKVCRENQDSILARIALTAFHQREGDQALARQLAGEILAINPEVTVERAMELIPGLEAVIPRSEFERYPDDLRAAGLPAGASATVTE